MPGQSARLEKTGWTAENMFNGGKSSNVNFRNQTHGQQAVILFVHWREEGGKMGCVATKGWR